MPRNKHQDIFPKGSLAMDAISSHNLPKLKMSVFTCPYHWTFSFLLLLWTFICLFLTLILHQVGILEGEFCLIYVGYWQLVVISVMKPDITVMSSVKITNTRRSHFSIKTIINHYYWSNVDNRLHSDTVCTMSYALIVITVLGIFCLLFLNQS